MFLINRQGPKNIGISPARFSQGANWRIIESRNQRFFHFVAKISDGISITLFLFMFCYFLAMCYLNDQTSLDLQMDIFPA